MDIAHELSECPYCGNKPVYNSREYTEDDLNAFLMSNLLPVRCPTDSCGLRGNHVFWNDMVANIIHISKVAKNGGSE